MAPRISTIYEVSPVLRTCGIEPAAAIMGAESWGGESCRLAHSDFHQAVEPCMSEVPGRWTRLWRFLGRCVGLGTRHESATSAATRRESTQVPDHAGKARGATPDASSQRQSGPVGDAPSSSGGRSSQPPGSDPRGTLMLDAFMEGTDTPADFAQPPRDTSTENARRGGEQDRPAYYGTLAGPDQPCSSGSQSDSPEEVGLRGSPDDESAARQEAQRAVPPSHLPTQPPAEVLGLPETPRQADTFAPDTAGPQSATPAALPDYAALPPGEREPVPAAPPAGHGSGPAWSGASPQSGAPRGEAPAPAGRPQDWTAPRSRSSMLEEDQPALIPLAEREDQLARLEYVCHRLREARLPLCGLNGVLALLPLKTIQAGPRENVELQRAMKADLATLQNRLKLRFPSTVLVAGLEEDRGFEELVRRVGPQRADSQRFGHRFDVRSIATPGQLVSLCARMSGVFEDWVYTIYRERGSTARPGNSHLYGLLCTVRTQLQGRLLRVLTGGFGHDPHAAPNDESVAFSGCYFAATGRSEDRRAFVPAVFDKLIEEQNHVEWTGRARAEDRWLRLIGWLGFLAAAVLGTWLLVDVTLWLM